VEKALLHTFLWYNVGCFDGLVRRQDKYMPPSLSPGIVLLGLGPGDPALLTRQAWQWLEGLHEVYVRTRQHPTLQGLPAELQVISFDELYESSERFEDVYQQIIERVLSLGQRPQGVTYAVPGHPFVAEATCPEIARRARELGIPVRVIEGISFLEPSFTALGIDPLPRLQIVDALEVANLLVPPFPPDQPALIAQIYSRQVASQVKLTLNTTYPDAHPVRLLHAAGTDQQVIEEVALYEIDRSPHIGLLTTLYLPPLEPDTSVEAFQEVVAHLRAPDGCPWDREQTQQSLGPYLLEETYEALSALEEGDVDGFREELGDLLLLLIMLAQIASEEGEFNFADVVQGIHRKIVYRHPHVFGETVIDGTSGVLKNWENLKAAERKAKGKDTEKPKGIFDSLPKALPALVQSQEYQDRAAHVGFDWPTIAGVVDKFLEEWGEVQAAADEEELEKELGDLLFSAVNLARWNKFDAESMLRKANQRFKQRFTHIEEGARLQGRSLTDLSLDEMEALWQEAKRIG
jgi:tetrapyrrole methylase family protein/MazG family protein